MPARVPIFCLASGLLAIGCRLHGIDELPATHDPARPEAAAVPWEGLPDHLDGDVYRGPTAPSTTPHHHHDPKAADSASPDGQQPAGHHDHATQGQDTADVPPSHGTQPSPAPESHHHHPDEGDDEP